MEYKKQLVDYFLKDDIEKSKEELKKLFDDNIQYQEKTLRELKRELSECKKKKLKNHEIIWNISALINKTSIDMKITVKNLVISQTEWEERKNIRDAFLIIYEFFNTYDQLQKEFVILFKKLKDEFLEPEKAEINALVRNFRKRHDSLLRQIRHNTIAHGDKDLTSQIKLIENLSLFISVEIVIEFDTILNELGNLYSRMMKESLNDISLFNKL